MANRYEGMECVVHRGENFNKAVRDFQDKRASLVMRRLSACSSQQLKIIKQGLELQEKCIYPPAILQDEKQEHLLHFLKEKHPETQQ